ncbi:relaxase/mobilization nuclease domain-containing protein [Chryseobacterium gallinarum]|uniref:relaxase/mobilization nuclease domain-containing protein n=1 Tax=Chryseobacterium gallinarum TaxID=1324352 RepID=UPI0009E63E43|nr:relaxase/mobilization nuclease domain-containing protein [Chryseobacterium gallinarum]
MIAKCKAIAHGKTALEYIFRETKLKNKLLIQNLCGDTAKRIYEEMNLVSRFNSRCRNKFLRMEIGIAPKDEAGMNWKKLQGIACEFIQAMKLQEHQVVAVTHKDTDNLHIHIIANRMSMNGAVYDTTFVSNKAARVAEELSRKHGLTIAMRYGQKNAIKSESQSDTGGEQGETAHNGLWTVGKVCEWGLNGYASFRYDLRRQGVIVEQMTNKKGSIYGLKFHFEGQTFKASEIGREFGYNSLLKQFGLSYAAPYHSSVPIYQPKSPLQEKRQPTPSPEPSLVESVVDVVAEGIASGVGGVLDFQVHGENYAETAFQRRLRRSQQEKETGTKDVGNKFSLLKEENHERTLTFAHKSISLQVIIVSVLWLFKTVYLKALRSFLNRYLSIHY